MKGHVPSRSRPESAAVAARLAHATRARAVLMFYTLTLLTVGASSLTAQTAAPQPTTRAPLALGDALDRADVKAFANRAMAASSDAKRAGAIAPLRGILPTVRFDAGYVETTDPIGAFGTMLRQRSIAQASFDPARLNNPARTPNYTGAMIVEQPIFNADAWLGRRAASRVAEAAIDDAEWTRDDTRYTIVRAYFGAVLAQEKVAALTIAQRAAREHVRQAELMAKNGMATPADALLASVKSGEVDVQLLVATGDAASALRALATAMGTPTDSQLVLPAGLPTLAASQQVAEDALSATATSPRADVRSADLSRQAAADDATRARSTYLPRLNGFARYDWNSALRPYGGDKNWTVGVMASWSPFTGASELSEARAASARHAAATAMAEGSSAKAALETSQATISLGAMITRATIVARAVQQSVDAHRIVGRRYTNGLATVVELLDAAAIETSARLSDAAARHDLILAAAARRHALGLDPGTLRSLDSAPRDAVASIAP